jgi:hypothetical protein
MKLSDLPVGEAKGEYTKDDRNILDIWHFNYLTGIGRDRNDLLYAEQIVIGPGMKVCLGNWDGRKVEPGEYPFYYLADEEEPTPTP